MEQNNTWIQLIWDFKGPTAKQTATHHVIHLKEYCALEKINNLKVEIQVIHQMHSIAYMVVEKENMLLLRDALKPHRAKYYTV